MPVSEQPMRKLLGVLSPTISWLKEQGSVAISAVPAGHLDAIKQLERIGIVYKRNNRSYELQKIRLKKLLGNEDIESLHAQENIACDIKPAVSAEAIRSQVISPEVVSPDVLSADALSPDMKATLN